MMFPPLWNAFNRTRPSAGFPLFTRSSRDSIPWSTEFLIICTSGSPISSITVLSSSVSSPDSSNRTFLPAFVDTSRTSLAIFWKVAFSGTILIDMTWSCISLTILLNWERFLFAAALVLLSLPNTSLIRALAITSSPTRFTRLSSFWVSTFTVSADFLPVADWTLSAFSTFSGVVIPFSTNISPSGFSCSCKAICNCSWLTSPLSKSISPSFFGSGGISSTSSCEVETGFKPVSTLFWFCWSAADIFDKSGW